MATRPARPGRVRLWSLHPRYLDGRGLVALWREALLAQKVLRGETRGYRSHPQLQRFREAARPDAAIGLYLLAVLRDGERRGYGFDASKIGTSSEPLVLNVTSGQLAFEWRHLRGKLRIRAPDLAGVYANDEVPAAHPLFHVVPGPVADWERLPG